MRLLHRLQTPRLARGARERSRWRHCRSSPAAGRRRRRTRAAPPSPAHRAIFTRDDVARAARLERRSRAGGVAGVPRRLQGARRAHAHAGAVAGAVRRVATRSTRTTRRGARILRAQFYAVPRRRAATARDRGLVTGYYEPLLDGLAAARPGVSACRCTRRPTICCRRSRRALSGAQGQARARPRRGQARRAVLAARRHRARQGRASPARRSCTSTIRSTRSSCRSRARAACSSPKAA